MLCILLSSLTWLALSRTVLCFPTLSLLLSPHSVLGMVTAADQRAPGHNKGAAIGMHHSGNRVFALEMCRKRRILHLVGPEFCKTIIVLHHWWLVCNNPEISDCTGKGHHLSWLSFHCCSTSSHFWWLQNELSLLLLFWCFSFFPSFRYLLSSFYL